MRFFFFLQALNLYPNKQKYKVNKRNTLLQETGLKKIIIKRKQKKEKETYFKCCNNLQEGREGVSKVWE